jgi:membrane-associated phospholipid phosphatase
MMVSRTVRVALVCAVVFCSAHAHAGGGFLGIDHRLNFDNSGIWNRNVQNALLYTLVGAEIVGAVWEGGETRLGRTFWQSIDSSAIGAVSSEAMKHIFTRARPIQENNPNAWFQGGSHYSFPSGEVTAVAAIITPFVLEYHDDYPAVYALELLPLYDAIGRMKSQAHWQTDVLAGFALGTLAGYYAHSREQPIFLNILPGGFMIGVHKRF